MNDTLLIDLSSDDGRQCRPGAVGNDLGIDLASALEDAKNGSLAIGAAASFPLDAFGTKVRFVDFSPQGTGFFTVFGNSLPDQSVIRVSEPGQSRPNDITGKE